MASSNDVPVENKLITLTTALSKYPITRSEIEGCPYIEARNPYYRRGPPMRLYDETDLKEFIEKLKVQKIESAKKAEEVKQAAKRASQQLYISLLQQNQKQELQAGTTQLPINIWTKIAEHLTDDFEYPGILSATRISKDLCSLAQVCRDTRLAVRDVWPSFAQTINTKHSLLTSDTWKLIDTAISKPLSLSVVMLKNVLKLLYKPTTGLKAELIKRILDAFKLIEPTYICARVLWERIIEPNAYCDYVFIDALKAIRDDPHNIKCYVPQEPSIQPYMKYKELYNYISGLILHKQSLKSLCVKYRSLKEFREAYREAAEEYQAVVSDFSQYEELGRSYVLSLYKNPALCTKIDYIKSMLGEIGYYVKYEKLDIAERITKSALRIYSNTCLTCMKQACASGCSQYMCGTCCRNTGLKCHRHKS